MFPGGRKSGKSCRSACSSSPTNNTQPLCSSSPIHTQRLRSKSHQRKASMSSAPTSSSAQQPGDLNGGASSLQLALSSKLAHWGFSPQCFHITKKDGSTTSKDTMMDEPEAGKNNISMLFFIGLCAPTDMGKIGEAQQKKGAKNNGSINGIASKQPHQNPDARTDDLLF